MPTLVLCVASPLIARAIHFRTPSVLVAVFVASYLFALLSVRRGVVQGESRFAPLAANTFFEATFRLIAMFAVCFWLPRAYGGIATHAVTALIALLLLPFPHTRARVPLGPVLRYLASAFGATAMYAAFFEYRRRSREDLLSGGRRGDVRRSILPRTRIGDARHAVLRLRHPAPRRGTNDRDELRRRFLRICAQYAALAAAAVIAIAILRRQLVAIFLGSAYANAQTLLVPISVAIAIGGLAFIACQLPMAVGSFRFLPWYAAVYVAEIVVVAVWHPTMLHVVYVVIGAQVVALAAITLLGRR